MRKLIFHLCAATCMVALLSLSTAVAQETPPAAVETGAVAGEAPAAEAATSRSLDELAWMIGAWMAEDGERSVSVECTWTKHGHFMVKRFSVKEAEEVLMEGMQIIGWDPAAQRIRSWTYDSEGGFGQGHWTRDGDSWLVKKTFTLATGEKASAVNVLTKIDDQTASWESVNREVNGEILPNQPEVTLQKLEADDSDSAEESVTESH